MDVADLPGGWRKERVAAIPFGRDQFGQRRRYLVDRIACQLRVGDVSLDAFDRELAAQGAATPVLDHVAGALNRSGFADDAEVRRFATLAQCFAHHNGAVCGGAFFVTGEQEGNAQR